jgi:SAM-dependent methyltransferase
VTPVAGDMPMRPSTLVAALLALWLAACAPVTPAAPGPASSLGAYVPTPPEVVERMLALAGVTGDDMVYDLGSGDGRIVIHAARRYGARAVGVEIDPTLVWFSVRNARRAGVEDRATFLQQDALGVDVSPATVVTLYLTPAANLRLRPILRRQLRPGARVVSHEHDMGEWAPDRVERVVLAGGIEHTIYLWRIVPRAQNRSWR